MKKSKTKSPLAEVNEAIVPVKGVIKALVHGLEDLTKTRIKSGQRIASAFRAAHIGQIDAAQSPEEKEKLQREFDGILDMLKTEYIRMTDGIVHEDFDIVTGSLPTPKKFRPTPVISSYGMLLNIDQYIRRLNEEKLNTKQLELALKEELLYTEYLEKIPGIGPKIAGVLISEFDFEKARYVSNMESYAGLNTTIVGVYEQGGMTKYVPHIELMRFFEQNPGMSEYFLDDGTPVKITSVGTSKKAHSLVEKDYRKADGTMGKKLSINFNPYLQAKLIAVLGPSLLKVNKTYLDGEVSTFPERLKLAESLGFDAKTVNSLKIKQGVADFLASHGHHVQVVPGEFGKFYYDYRTRIKSSNKPEDKAISDIHLHRMANRYMLRMFLRELYMVGRHLKGLPIYQTYESAKLGYQMHISDRLKNDFGIGLEKITEHLPVCRDYPPAIREFLDSRNKPMAIVK